LSLNDSLSCSGVNRIGLARRNKFSADQLQHDHCRHLHTFAIPEMIRAIADLFPTPFPVLLDPVFALHLGKIIVLDVVGHFLGCPVFSALIATEPGENVFDVQV